MNNRVREMALDSVFIALYFVLAFSPIGFTFTFFGLVPVAGTTLHVIVLIVAFLGDFRRSVLLGFVFGFVSLLRAWLAPINPTDPLFINPLLSILPRVLFGLMAAYLGRYVYRQFSSNRFAYMVLSSLGAGILTIAHTILVLSAVYLLETTTFLGVFVPVFNYILIGLAGVEMVLAMTLVPMTTVILQRSPFFKNVER